MTEKNRSPPLSDGTSTEAIEPTILFQKGQVHLYGIKIRYPQHGKTFGNLEFAGEDKTEQRRINGRMAVLSRSFNLYSDVQRADDIVVILPAEAGEKHFDLRNA